MVLQGKRGMLGTGGVKNALLGTKVRRGLLSNEPPAFNPVTQTGAITYLADNSNEVNSCAVSWTTTGRYFSCANNSSNAIGDFDWWWAGWAFVTDDTTNRTLFSKQATPITGVKGAWILFNINPNDKFLFIAGNNTGTTATVGTSATSLNAWHFVMAYHDSVNNVIAISLDGGAFTTTAFSAGLATNADVVFIGTQDTSSTAIFSGRMQGITFGSQPPTGIAALATAIRDALYNSGNGILFSQLTATQIAAWGMQSWYDFSGPSVLTVDRLNNSNLSNTGPVPAGAAHVAGTPFFLGDAVTEWDDQTGHSNNATPVSNALCPGFFPQSLNNLSGISFDGATQYYQIGTAATWKFLHDGTGMTFILVATATLAQDGFLAATEGAASGPPGILVERINSSSSLRFFVNNNSANIVQITAAGFPLNVPTIIIITFQAGTNGANVYINGSLAATGTASGVPSSSNPGNTLFLGAPGDLTPSNIFFGGTIYACEAINQVLSPVQVTRANAFFTSRYGLNVPVSMPASNRQLLATGFDTPGADYAAFPVGLHKCFNGDLVATYYRGSSHNNDSDGYMTMRRSTDGGTTWGAESTLLAHASNTPGGNTFTNLANGTRIVGVYIRQNYSPAPTVKLFFWYSDDNLNTFSTPNDITSAVSYTNFVAPGSYIVELTPGGRLIMPVYGNNTGQGFYTLQILYSDNGGTTWAVLANVPASSIVLPQEPQLGKLQDGRLMLLIRDTPTATIYLTYSSDGGSTWTPISAVFSGVAWPRWTQMTNGSIIVLTRHADPSQTNEYGVYRLSWNNGLTWGPEQYLDPSITGFSLYGAAIELTPNYLGVSWSEEINTGRALVQYLNLG